MVAVFPGLSPSAATAAVRSSALGDEISRKIAAGVRSRLPTVEVPTFGALKTLINQIANRGLSDVLSPEDLFFLADRIGAQIVVIGKIRGTIDKRYRTLEEIAVSYEARDVATGRVLKVAERTLSASQAKALRIVSKYERGGEWKLGAYAPPFKISLDRELNYVILRTILSLMAQTRDTLKGHRLAVAPTLTEGFHDPAAADFLRAFNEEWTSLAKKANPWIGGDAREKALDTGPVTIMGTRFNTLREARDQLRVLQRQAKLSVSGRLSREMTELIHREIQRQAGNDFKVTLSYGDRRQIEDFIQRERRIYEETGSIDPDSIARLRTSGAEYLLVSRFRQAGPMYTLEAYVLDMKTGEGVGPRVSRSLDPRLTSELNQRFE